MTLDPSAGARALGGNVSGRNILAPGPRQSRSDRSLSMKMDPAAPDGLHRAGGPPGIEEGVQ